MSFSFSNFTVYELTDEYGNRYGQTVDFKSARTMANQQAKLSNTRILVMGLANTDLADGRYGERVYYEAKA